MFESLIALWDSSGISNPARADDIETIRKTLENGGLLILAIEDDELVGSVWLTHDHRRVYLHHMAVFPSRQNQKIGHYLMEHSISYAKKLGLQVKLEVNLDNFAAVHLYEKFGFLQLSNYGTMIKREF